MVLGRVGFSRALFAKRDKVHISQIFESQAALLELSQYCAEH
jgi:hypothetical protein